MTPRNDPERQLVHAERGAGDRFRDGGGRAAARRRFTRVDEPRLLAEIESEFAALEERYAAALGPVRAAIDGLHRRSLATPLPPDTYPARLG